MSSGSGDLVLEMLSKMLWGAGRNQTSLADFEGKFMKMAGSKTNWRLYLSAGIGFSCNLRTELDRQAPEAAPVRRRLGDAVARRCQILGADTDCCGVPIRAASTQHAPASTSTRSLQVK